ncbi:hypothetical protein AURDEDRAFT_182487 [Auricularia subglabra TFB-10046 SS5]|nr:hypothetical protein AURDEDRAFT_182487 [Auricularia subglabra TFB-10046 SS5]
MFYNADLQAFVDDLNTVYAEDTGYTPRQTRAWLQETALGSLPRADYAGASNCGSSTVVTPETISYHTAAPSAAEQRDEANEPWDSTSDELSTDEEQSAESDSGSGAKGDAHTGSDGGDVPETDSAATSNVEEDSGVEPHNAELRAASLSVDSAVELGIVQSEAEAFPDAGGDSAELMATFATAPNVENEFSVESSGVEMGAKFSVIEPASEDSLDSDAEEDSSAGGEDAEPTAFVIPFVIYRSAFEVASYSAETSVGSYNAEFGEGSSDVESGDGSSDVESGEGSSDVDSSDGSHGVHYGASTNVHYADSYSVESESDVNSDSADFDADSSAVDSDLDSVESEYGANSRRVELDIDSWTVEWQDDVQSWVVAGPATNDIDAYGMAARADARYFATFGITPGDIFEVGLDPNILFWQAYNELCESRALLEKRKAPS